MQLSNLLSYDQNLQLVFDSMNEAVIAHDLERKITFFNRAAEKLTGLDRKEVLGRDCHEIIQGGLCGSRCAFCETCIPTFDLLSYPLIIADRQGTEHQVEMTVVPMKNTLDRVVGILASARDVTELNELRRALKRERSFQGIIGRHHRMQEVFELVRQVASTDVSVLVHGESGTGKELIAAAIHAESARASGPFIPVNSSALPEGLLESELFGHVKGAFTGAIKNKKGRFEMASGGTLFLDEIGDLSSAMQVKLLRALQEKRFSRVGAEEEISVDVRIISATNRDLKSMVASGLFRQDLFFRLSVVPVELPALRERRIDIAELCEVFLERFARQMQRPIPILTLEAKTILMHYDWPGNVRELMNALQYAMVMTQGHPIEPQHLPPEIRAETIKKSKKKRPGRNRKLTQNEVEHAMQAAGGNKALAAKNLGVGRSTLYRYIRENGS